MKKFLVCILALFVAIFPVLLAGCSDDEEGEILTNVTVKSDLNFVNQGSLISFTIDLSNVPATQSVGIKLVYDDNCFDLYGEPNLLIEKDAFFNYSEDDKIAVVMFESSTKMDGEVFAFSLRALEKTDFTQVSCEFSLRDAENNLIHSNIVPWNGSIN